VPNRIDEIHIFQQGLSKFDVGTYTVRCLTRVKVIYSFYEGRDLRLHLGAESRVDAGTCGRGLKRRIT
jgi:hypothetical protein